MQPVNSPSSPTNSGSVETKENVSEVEQMDVQNSERLSQLLQLKESLGNDARRLASRFAFMLFVFAIAAIILIFALQKIFWFSVGRFAVIKDVQIEQNQVNQGQVEISYEVLTPGRVSLRRTSEGIASDLIFDYKKPCKETQHWNWNYTPGSPILVQVWSRKGMKVEEQKAEFQTLATVDIVFLLDTTEAMDTPKRKLQEKIHSFALDLEDENLIPRFSLIAFGDALQEKDWFQAGDFTDNSLQIVDELEKAPNFEGGDEPESALDVLALAIERVKKESVGHQIRFYLITNQDFHPQTADGKLGVSEIAQLLRKNHIMLEVFGNPDFRLKFTELIGDCGHFREIGTLGEILQQKKRFLED